jgi:hypothetical protein
MIHELLQWKLCHLEERFTTSVGYWANGVFLKQKLYMLNRMTEPRISLIDEFYLLSLYVLKQLLSQVKLETSLGTCQPSVFLD